jgi:hypothetical protein
MKWDMARPRAAAFKPRQDASVIAPRSRKQVYPMAARGLVGQGSYEGAV